METLLEKAQRLGIKPQGVPMQETLLQKAQRLGIKPATAQTEQPTSVVGTLTGPLNESVQGLKTLYGGGEQGIANKLLTDVQQGAADIQAGMQTGGLAGVPQVLKGVTKAGFRTAGDVAGAIYAPVGAVIGATGLPKVFEKAGELSQNKGGILDRLTDIPAVQEFAMKHPNASEDFGRLMNLIFASQEKGTIEPKTAIPRTIEQIKTGVSEAKTMANTAIDKVQAYKETRAAAKELKSTQKVVDELAQVESGYAKLRKNQAFSKDANAGSRERIASSNVLEKAIDDTGTIRTGDAVKNYKSMTIDGKESLVSDLLKKEGAKVKLSTIQTELERAIYSSNLEGAALKNALNNVKKEISGLRLKADLDGNIPLELAHKAKINKYSNIDYNTPSEVKVADKAIASGYKKIVEETSNANIKPVNAELSNYYKDLEYLQSLDGRKVQGGKLGKYTAQLSGQLIGHAAGAVGGPVGSAIGGIVGGELASKLKGASMSSKFGGKTTGEVPVNPILEKAAAEAKAPRLMLPAPKEGSPRSTINRQGVINLPAKSQSTIDQAYSKSLGNLKKTYSDIKTNNTTVIPKSITQKPIWKQANNK